MATRISDLKPTTESASDTPEAPVRLAHADSFDALLATIADRPKRVSNRKQDRSKRTAQQIMNAALRVFARDGISRPKIADIAAEAGVPTSTLYDYYKSKEELASEVPLSYLAAFFSKYRDAVAGVTDARERILLYMSMSADFARENAEWARLFYLEIWPSVFVNDTEELRHSIDDFARVLVLLIRQGMDEGAWSAMRDPYETAAILIGGLNQVIITWILYRRPRNLTKAGTAIVERILNLLAEELRVEQSARNAPRRR